ncbi:MAG: biotin/lipoyl-binding protein [Deltaproteobacteria bacterium]|nr:biotin/lipoyl-binding protein [Deltaproteobacteria bacterium]
MAGPAKKLAAQVANSEREVSVEPAGEGCFRVIIDGQEHLVDARPLEGGSWSMLIDGKQWVADVEPGKDGDLLVEINGTSTAIKIIDPRRRMLAQAALRPKAQGGPETVRAPMPGRVVKVLAKAGERVTAGQGLVVIEAMKMENELRAPRDALVQSVQVKEGQAVEAQEPLVVIE